MGKAAEVGDGDGDGDGDGVGAVVWAAAEGEETVVCVVGERGESGECKGKPEGGATKRESDLGGTSIS